MKKIIVLFGIFLLTAGLAAADDEDGGYAGAFLRVPLQPRAAAMGGAYIGLSDDAAGQLFNPAGLTGVTKLDFSSAYRVMKLDRKLGYVSFVIPTNLESAIGINWTYASSGSVERRSNSGYLQGGSLSSDDHAFSVTFAKQFLPFLGTGARLVYLYKKFDDISGNSIGINLGIMISVDSLFEYGSMEERPINDIKVGIVAQNLAAKYSWNQESVGLDTDTDDAVPVEMGLGISFHTLNRTLLIAMDGRKNDKQAFVFRAGAEYPVHDRVDLRAGFDDGILTAGLGFHWPVNPGTMVNIDYAFSTDRADEGSEHIFGLSIRF